MKFINHYKELRNIMNNTVLTETTTSNMDKVQSSSLLLENSSVLSTLSTLTTSSTSSEVPTIISSTSSLLTPSPSTIPPNNDINNNVVPYIFIGLGSIVGVLFLSFVGIGLAKSIKKQRQRDSINQFVNNSSWEYSHTY